MYRRTTRMSLLTVLWLCILAGCKPPEPIAIYVLLDTSASFGKFRKMTLERITDVVHHLEPGLDQLTILTLSQQGVRLIQDGTTDISSLEQTLQAYSVTTSAKYKGTPYRTGLERVTRLMGKRKGAIVVLGDLADESTGKKDENLSPAWMAQLGKQLTPEQKIAFLGVAPKNEQILDPLRAALGDRCVVTTSVQESLSARGTRALLERMGR